MHGVYDCARFVPCSPLTHGVMLPSHLQNGIGTSDFGHFHSSIPSLRSPLRTLHACPHGQPRITRGRDGWLNPISWGTCTSLSFASLPGALRKWRSARHLRDQLAGPRERAPLKLRFLDVIWYPLHPRDNRAVGLERQCRVNRLSGRLLVGGIRLHHRYRVSHIESSPWDCESSEGSIGDESRADSVSGGRMDISN